MLDRAQWLCAGGGKSHDWQMVVLAGLERAICQLSDKQSPQYHTFTRTPPAAANFSTPRLIWFALHGSPSGPALSARSSTTK